MYILARYRWTVMGAVGCAVVFAFFFLFGFLGWPGSLDSLAVPPANTPPSETTDYKGQKVVQVVYGESVDWSSMIKQPSSTWSNLIAVVFGFILLVKLDRAGRFAPAAGENPMCRPSIFSIPYAYAVVFLGPGSMFFHASMTHWGGVVDNGSMNLYITLILLYDVTRVFGVEIDSPLRRGIAALIYFGVNGLLVLALALGGDGGLGKILFGGLIGATVLVEAVNWILRVTGSGGRRRHWCLFWIGMLLFGIAFCIWLDSQCKGCPFYSPEAVLQGHAVWHMLAAVAAFMFWLYFRSETKD